MNDRRKNILLFICAMTGIGVLIINVCAQSMSGTVNAVGMIYFIFFAWYLQIKCDTYKMDKLRHSLRREVLEAMNGKDEQMPRVETNDKGGVCLGDGDYGKDAEGKWHVRPPGRHAGSIPHHTVVEHEDGTITVSPSIWLWDATGAESWHGYLEKGVWREV